MGLATLVTGLWDIKRDQLSEGWSRSYDHYLSKFETLLKTEDNMIIFGDENLREFVKERRSEDNTQFIVRDTSWFKNEFYDKIQKIRTDPEWYNLAGWLTESTQAKLEMYNPLVMSKMFLLNDARILDKFDSAYMYWIDAGLTSTVHPGYFTHDKVIEKLPKYTNKFTFICFPYDASNEIHGFKYNELNSYANDKVNKVARGGFFGGPKYTISELNSIYYGLMRDSLDMGLMGTEESLFSIICYKHPDLVSYFEIDGNGLIGKFFEDLKNDKLEIKNEGKGLIKPNNHDKNNVALYVLTFNFPKQFEMLCKSFEQYDNNLLLKTKKFLLNNSTNRDTDEEYDKLCEKYGFEEIHKDNLGICGGRQFISEHSDENNFDYHMFFEDDMFFYLGNDEFCRNGFRRKIKGFYDLMLEIIWRENFDFLKWNFSEFFGDNTKQWAWHNIPSSVRSELFPDNPIKFSDDVNKAPFTKYKNIKSFNGLPYATGEIFYCNWPQIVSREGNKKMFLETKWARPFEQTWMSYIYQETLKGNITPGILLATPTEHNRFEHYSGSERKES